MAYRRSTRRRVSEPRREFEWSGLKVSLLRTLSPVRSTVLISSVLPFSAERQSPRGDHHPESAVSSGQCSRRTPFPSGMPAFASRTSTRTRSTSRTSLSTGQTRIGSPGSPAALITPATASFPAEYANWNEGGGWAVDVKAQRKLNGRQRSLWLFADPRPQGRTCGTTICLSV